MGIPDHLASLTAQLVKNPPAMQENLVRFLGCEDPMDSAGQISNIVLSFTIPSSPIVMCLYPTVFPPRLQQGDDRLREL